MKIGLIGLKGHQSVVMSGARELGGCEVIAVADDDPEELARFKRSEPLARDARTFADWRRVVEHAPMDVCVVCDENGVRAEQLIVLAERAVHIVTEKPLATTMEDLARVRKAMSSSKSRLTMLLTMRHEAKYQTMRDLILAGAVGEVRQAAAQKSYRLGQRPEWQKRRLRLGGTIPYIGIHALDLLWWTTLRRFTHVAALHSAGVKPEMGETEDSASILLALDNGGSATARLDYLRPATAPSHGDDRLRVIGTEGVIEAAYPHGDLSLITADKPPRRIQPRPTDNLFVNFARALRSGHTSRIPQEDCFYITEVVLRAREAADQRKMLPLPAPPRA
jgi:predicted dehydrogenase